MTRTLFVTAGVASALVSAGAWSAEFQMPERPAPAAVISNGLVRAQIYLPDPDQGFYRSTRFDWSGAIASLQYEGHEFYGPWFTKTDPPVRDFIYKDADIIVGAQSAIVGPAEEFRTPLGYATAKAGETFVKIGVGVLRKPDDGRYSGYANYQIADAGKWSVRTSADTVESTQEVNDPGSGYGYAYRKTLRLTSGKPELVIEHSLKNLGRLAIQTRQYNHNFLVLDRKPTGPDFIISVPFDIQASAAPDAQLAAIQGREIRYRKTLQDQDRVFFGMQGFGKEPGDYDITIQDRSSGAGVRVTADRPLANLSLWSIRSVISMEPDVDIDLAPGASTDWTYTYTYFVHK
jgi:hypothetical protein